MTFKYPITIKMRHALLPVVVMLGRIRSEVREDGYYELADKIRVCIKGLGFKVEDGKKGSFTVSPEATDWYLHFSCDGSDFPYTAKQIIARNTGVSHERRYSL